MKQQIKRIQLNLLGTLKHDLGPNLPIQNANVNLKEIDTWTNNCHSYRHSQARADSLQGRDEILGRDLVLLGEDDDPIGQADGRQLLLALHLARPFRVLRLVRRQLELHDDFLRGQNATL